ncbi:hypothetical protein N9E02_01020 [Ilumatobacteraceae bacterium]|jgi:hypothetical protein|nr:hypothetical protein [Ilumatobacteraceae bacterium]
MTTPNSIEESQMNQHAESTHPLPSGIDRRSLLLRSGVVLGMGAFLSACAKNFGGDTAPGRVGLADEATPLPDASLDDLGVVRTMQSLESAVVAALQTMAGAGMYTSAQTTYIDRFIADHNAASSALGDAATAAGGSPYDCPNEWFMERFVLPVYTAVAESDDVSRDARSATLAFETMLAHSYQHMVGLLTEPAHRKMIMMLGSSATRRSALLSILWTAPSHGYLGPALSPDATETDAAGFPIHYAVPATFGLVSQIPVTVGKPDDEGSRYQTAFQTPAENTFVFDYMSC